MTSSKIAQSNFECASYKKHLSAWFHPPNVFILASLFICFITVYLLVVRPRYISLPIHAPDYYQEGEVGDWQKTILLEYEVPFLPPISGKVYILRKEAVSINEETSWNSIASYFDSKLYDLGWVRSDTYSPCKLYMPEAKFLKDGKDGFLYYRRKSYKPIIDYEEGDLICLAIWKPEGVVSYNIILLTAKPSLLVILNDIIS